MAKLYQNTTIGKSYADTLKHQHHGTEWGTTAMKWSGLAVRDLINERPYLRTALDYGCGKGTLARGCPGPEWSEYDPGIPHKDVCPAGPFDLVTCTDVIEHVEPDKLDAVVAHLSELTGKVLFMDIPCVPSLSVFSEGPWKGQDLHLIVEDPEWWIDKFETKSDLTIHKTVVSRKRSKRKEGWLTRIQITLER